MDGFVDTASTSFGFIRRMPVDDVVEMVATYSAVITAGADVRSALLASTRDKLAARFPGRAEIDVPMRSWCWRGERIPR